LNYTEEELIAGCKRRSAKHEEVFYKKYYGYVMGISLSYSKERDLALEITNDVFLKFFASVKKVESFQTVKAWLRRITVNTAIDYYRKNKKYQNHLDLEIDIPNEVEINALSSLGFEDIIKLINQLPEDQKLVFNLYEVEGYSHKEIADRMGITEGSSRVYLTRAKVKLRQLVHIHLREYEGR
jgi:RNA polymerase sigma-70 factor (ECF subfamily)